MKSHRILRIITNSEAEPGGAANHVFHLSSRLNTVFETMVVCGTGERLIQRLKRARVPVLSLPTLKRSLSPLLDAACTKELYRIIVGGKFDIVAAHSTKAGLVGRLAAAMAHTPLIVFTAHGFSFNEPSGRLRHYVALMEEKLGARLGDHIIAVSDYDRRSALQKGVCREDKITTIHNGIDAGGLAQTRGFNKEDIGLPPNSRVIGTIANFYPNKGLGFFVDAFEIVSRNLKDVHAVLIGDGPMLADICSQVESKGLKDRVHFYGYREDATQFIPAFDVFALSSVKEGFPWALLEAMALARPVAATEVGGIAEMVGEAAAIVPPGDPPSLASAIIGLLSDRRRATALGMAAKERVMQNFTLEKMVKKTGQLYLSLLDGRGK